MMYKIILSNTKETIPVLNKEQIENIITKITEGNKIIVCPHGIFNPSYLVAIVEYFSNERPEEVKSIRESLERKVSNFDFKEFKKLN